MNVAFDVLTPDEKQGLQQKLGRNRLPEGALAQVKNVICVASGKGGVGKSTVTANLAAALAIEGYAAGAMDADVWGYSIPRMLGVERQAARLRAAQDPADRGGRRRQGDVDRLLRRGRRGRRLARADAPQGDPAVPRGRRLGRARLPADRSSARHRRRLDDARAAAAAGEDAARHDAAAGGAGGRPPRRRDGRQVRPRGDRRGREHVRLHDPRRHPLHDLRRGRRPAARPTTSTSRCWGRSPSRRRFASTPTRAGRSSPRTPMRRPHRRSSTWLAASSPRRRASCRWFRCRRWLRRRASAARSCRSSSRRLARARSAAGARLHDRAPVQHARRPLRAPSGRRAARIAASRAGRGASRSSRSSRPSPRA